MSADFTSRLPDELVLAILDYLPLQPCLIYASHLARRWRNLARSHPTFWKYISLDIDMHNDSNSWPYDLANAQIQSCDSSKLVVRVRVLQTSTPSTTSALQYLAQVSTLIMTSMERVIELDINTSPNFLQQLIEAGLFITTDPFLQLERLAIDSDRPHSMNECVKVHWAPLYQRMPRLRILHLHNVEPPMLSDLPQYALEEFRWSGTTTPRFSEEFSIRLTDVLTQFPLLQTLVLSPNDARSISTDTSTVGLLPYIKDITLPGSVLSGLDLRRLQRAQNITASGQCELNVLGHLVNHMVWEGGPNLELTLWSAIRCEKVQILELGAGTRPRRRVFDDNKYPRLSNIEGMSKIAGRVHRLSVPVKRLAEVLECFGDSPSVSELILRVAAQYEFASLTKPGVHIPRIRTRSLTIQSQSQSLELKVASLVAALQDVFDLSLHGKIQLVLRGVRWSDARDVHLLDSLFA